VVSIAAMDRDGDLSGAIASLVRVTRNEIGWSQDQLAARARVSQSRVSRIERGLADDVAFGAVRSVVTACGARWSIVSPRTESRVRQRDPAHGRCSAHIRLHLEALGYVCEQEVEIGDGPSRGWIDLLAYQPASRVLHLGEVKTEARDVGAIQRQIRWYERLAWSAGRGFGWRPRLIGVGLYLLATVANDDLVGLNRELLAQVFPLRSRELAVALADPDSLDRPPAWALAMIDPLSRRSAWLRATRSDGRRTPAPYRDYADFMKRWRSSRRR